MYLKGIGSDDIDSVHMAQDRINRLGFVNTELIIRFNKIKWFSSLSERPYDTGWPDF